MKTKLIISLTLLALVLTACGGGAAPTAPESARPSQSESQPIVVPTLTVASPAEAAIPTESVAPVLEPTAPAAAPSSGVSFANDVKPILSGSCVDCHGGNQLK